MFLSKLQEKKQSIEQQNQVQFAINLFYEISPPLHAKQSIVRTSTISYQIQGIQDNVNRLLVAGSNSSYESRTTIYAPVSATPSN